MEAYGITCGIKKDVDDFITQLQGKYFPYEHKDKDGNWVKNGQAQLNVAPIQLWKFSFPEPQKNLAMATIFGAKPNQAGQDKKLWKWIFRFAEIFRKTLGLEKPEYKGDIGYPIGMKNMSIICLGVKKDYTMPNGVEGI